MQIKVYVPKIIELPGDCLPILAKRAAGRLNRHTRKVWATRGHLVRQAVLDGLLPELNGLIGKDGTVDLTCDPGGAEIPLEIGSRTVRLTHLVEALKDELACSQFLADSEKVNAIRYPRF